MIINTGVTTPSDHPASGAQSRNHAADDDQPQDRALIGHSEKRHTPRVYRESRIKKIVGAYFLDTMKVYEFKEGKWIEKEEPCQGKRIALLVHGYAGGPDDLSALAAHLSKHADYDEIIAVKYQLSMLKSADMLGGRVAQIVEEQTPDDAHVDIFAHSLGGLVSRSAIENHGSDNKVDFLATMGTPHLGVRSALLISHIPLKLPLARELSPDSPFLKNLNEGPRTDCNYYSLVGTNGKAITKMWTVKLFGEKCVSRLVGGDENDGMVTSSSAGYDLSSNCAHWELKTFPVNHNYIKGQSHKTEYPPVFDQIDMWIKEAGLKAQAGNQ